MLSEMKNPPVEYTQIYISDARPTLLNTHFRCVQMKITIYTVDNNKYIAEIVRWYIPLLKTCGDIWGVQY